MSISGSSAGSSTATATLFRAPYVYPLKLARAGNKHYLVDQLGVPYFLYGDAAWSILTAVTTADATAYLDDRQSRGINAIAVVLVDHITGNTGKSTQAGDAPFTTPGDFTTPNEAYFAHADAIINLAASRGICVFLHAAYLGFNGGDEGWYVVMGNNGTTNLTTYGNYLGNRYKNFPNIVWINAGDYDPPDKTLTRAVANGIKANDPNHLHTVHCNEGTAGLDFWSGETWLDVDSTYDYLDRGAGHYVATDMATEYGLGGFKPCFNIEARYEAGGTGTAQTWRQQMWESVTGGGFGHIYGHGTVWNFDAGWQSALNAAGVQHLKVWSDLLSTRAFHTLVPDTTAAFITSGASSDPTRRTGARDAAGTLGIIYIPGSAAGSITVDRSGFARKIWARWYDPTNGTFSNVTGSPFTNTSTFTVSTPGNNAGGDGDWVMLLEATQPSLSDSAESNEMRLVFQNITWPRIGDTTGLVGSSSVGSVYVSLHTASPTDTGGQTSNETSYTNYARVGVARTAGGWLVSGTSPTIAVNASAIAFPKAGSGGSQTVTHFGVGTDASGSSGHLIYWSALDASLVVGVGVVPTFPAFTLTISRD